MNKRQRQIVNWGVLDMSGSDGTIRLFHNLHAASDGDRQTETQRFVRSLRVLPTISLEVLDADVTDACTTEDCTRDARYVETACGSEGTLTPSWRRHLSSVNISSESKRSLSKSRLFCIKATGNSKCGTTDAVS